MVRCKNIADEPASALVTRVRQKLSLSRAELADRLFLSRVQVWRLETGTRGASGPTRRLLVAMARGEID